MVYSQNHVVWTFVLLCFILAWCSYKGPHCGNRTARSSKSSRASLLPALVTKETSAGLPPGRWDPMALSQSQAMTTWGSGCFVLLALEARYAQLGIYLGSGSVCICMCLPEENCPDLHYGGRAELPAGQLSEVPVLRANCWGTLLTMCACIVAELRRSLAGSRSFPRLEVLTAGLQTPLTMGIYPL